MAKGFGSRGIPGMGGGMNMNMIKQAQKMQQDMLKMQQELEEKTYEASAGGGVVTASVSGKRELKSLTIDPDAVDPDDVEMLEDMIVAAVNEALRAAERRRRLQHAEAHRRAGPALLSGSNTAKSPAGTGSSRGFFLPLTGGAPAAWRTGRRRGCPPACPGTGAQSSGPRPWGRSGSPPPGRSAGGNGGTGAQDLGISFSFITINLLALLYIIICKLQLLVFHSDYDTLDSTI